LDMAPTGSFDPALAVSAAGEFIASMSAETAS